MRKTDVFFDTNIALCLAGPNPAKADISDRLFREGGVISVQVLNEFVNVTRRKYKMEWPKIDLALAGLRAACQVRPVDLETHDVGVVLAQRYRLQVYDGFIVAAALLAGCTTLYSEDMHDGLVIEGLKFRNPYAAI